MPVLLITHQAGETYGGSGKAFCMHPQHLSYREATLPTGVNTVDQKPSFATYNRNGMSRVYIVGGHTDNLVYTENFALLRQGILPPENPIISGAGSGTSIGVVASSGTGITANSIYYVSWWDNVHQRRSPLSGPSPTLALVNKNVAGTNLPITCPDASVTHLEVWRSDDGNTPRMVCRRTLGATGFVDATPTLSLGEAFDTDFEKFPRCRYNVIWHDRQVMAGDDRYPDRLYFSVMEEPERYAQFWLPTRKGEKIVALCVVRDSLIVLGARSSYVVTGYTEDDISMNILEPDIGCISHHGIALVHGYAFIPTHLGFYVCTGSSMHWVSQGHKETWMREYSANQDAYEAGWADNDVESHCYRFYCGVPTTSSIDSLLSGKALYWVLDYSGFTSQSGGQFSAPTLSFDVRARQDSAMARVALPGGRRSDIWVGGSDGILRKENVATDLDDDSDTFKKRMVIRTRHEMPNGPGGDEEDGCSIPTLWMFAQSESAAYSINLYLGDESAPQSLAPHFTESVPAGAQTFDDTSVAPTVHYFMVPKCVHHTRPNKQGRGITCEFSQEETSPSTKWLGWGCTVAPGRNTRGYWYAGGGE